MLLRLFLLFTLVPVVELALLIRIGGLIGVAPTLGLVIATGAAGAWLARREGLRSWIAVQREMAGGRVPGEELVHGLLILIASVLLVTPGVITDVAGFALLLRPARARIIDRLRERFTRQLEEGTAGYMGGPGLGVFWTSTRPADPGSAAPEGREIVVDEEEADESATPIGTGRS